MAVSHKKDLNIHVLVIDRDKKLAAMLSDVLLKTGACIPLQLDTIHEAQQRIDHSDSRVDICILEVFTDCVNEAAFAFIKDNARKIPCIVFTQSESASLGARCSDAGAKVVIDKKNFNKEDFVKAVYTVAYLHLINPGYNSKGTDTYENATDILLEKCPDSVTQWAEFAGITDRQLRGLVKKNSKISARDALQIAARMKKGMW